MNTPNMWKTITSLSVLAFYAQAECTPKCPSWFDDFGQKWLDRMPESPGMQMTIWSKTHNLHCLNSWNSPYENYTVNPPLLEDTSYLLASVTKPFTSLAVIKLVEEGLIDVNASVTSYLPEWAVEILEQQVNSSEIAQQITPWMFMHHTSGLPNQPNDLRWLALWEENPNLNMSRQETLQWAADNMPVAGPPGGPWWYSDTAYSYLGGMVEHITGLSLGAAVRKAGRFEELGMTGTWWDALEEPPEGAPPKAGQYLGEFDITNVNPTHGIYGGQGLISNSEDMARFARAFHHGFHLSEKGMEIAYSLVPTPDDVPSVGYGCGWHLEFVAGQKTWHHRGGWGTWMYYFPDLDVALTGAVNQFNLRPTMPLIVEDVVQHLLEGGHVGS